MYMLNMTLEKVAKQSIVYSYVLSQPFSTFVNAYPMAQNEILLEAEQLAYEEHGETVRLLQKKLNKMSYYEHEIDREFGLLTEYAVKKFQRENDLYVSGHADLETITAIVTIDIKNHL